MALMEGTVVPDFDTLLRLFHGRKVKVGFEPDTWFGASFVSGEFRGIWRDSVPYFPDKPVPALWITNWGEYFPPVNRVTSIETV